MDTSSSPTIDTLIPDIYELFEKGADLDSELTETFANNLVELLKQRFASYSTPRVDYLRMSNIGKDPLQLWYDINGYPDNEGNKFERETITPETKLKFLYGDLIEQLVIFLAKAAGHQVTNEQEQVEVEGVKGSLDCLIDGEVVDVKSASTFGLSKFQSEDTLRSSDSFGYIPQLSGYCEAKGHSKGYFIAVGKESGTIRLCPITAEPVKDRIKYLKRVLAEREPPGRCTNDKAMGVSGNRVLASPCNYCSHKEYCWRDANEGRGLLGYEYSSGTTYLTHVAKEPKVNRSPTKGTQT